MEEDSFISCIVSGDVGVLSQLLQQSTITSGCCSRQIVNAILRNGSTLLNVAIAHRSFDAARMLIGGGSEVNLPDSFRVDGCRRKPIHYACASGSLDLVRFFVEVCGVDVDDKDEGGSTPIHHAAVSGHIEIVEFLVSTGCNIHHRSNSGKTALWKAAAGGHRELVHLLYALGVDINVHNQVGETVLFECCRKIRLVSLVSDLVQFGADKDARDVEKNTALHLAAVGGNTPAGEILLSSGAELDCLNEYGNTPLHNAVIHGQTAFAVALLNHGAATDVRNLSGQSALYVAMLHLQKNSCRLLRRVGTRLTANERDMFEKYEFRRNEAKRGFYRWVSGMFSSPMDMTSACRIVIRRHLVTSPVVSVQKLPLPEALRHFLLLDDSITGFSQDDA